jgi:hypothetical protein
MRVTYIPDIATEAPLTAVPVFGSEFRLLGGPGPRKRGTPNLERRRLGLSRSLFLRVAGRLGDT